MKNLLFLSLCLLSLPCIGQKKDISGAFILNQGDQHTLWLFKDGYASQIRYKNSEYIGTKGGPFKHEGNIIVIATEYNDRYPDSVGVAIRMPATLKQQQLQLGNMTFDKAKTNPQALDGLWRITGRKTDNEIKEIPKGDRKTIKILVDGYFQWIAINPAVKGFYGTGGGQYTYSNTNYTENIGFFSRDNTRIGSKLGFKGEIIKGQWHHSGNSSKGDPIYEIWSIDK